ncbi:hypothetical protein DFJ77DRAFT_425933 [Powellomyces hirtus]|nr:hypothetical protein DFJ77DRAFT_425933 [Powellomyces hirtus]
MHASSERPQVIVVFDEEETDPTYCQQSRGNDGNLAGETAPLAIPDRQLVAAIAETVKCTDLVIRAETAVVSSHHNHRPLLDPRIAAIVSSVSTACRISLRTASIVVEAVFESLKFSASTSLAITRRALVAAVSSARTLHLIAMGKGKSISFFNVLDRYTSAGVYVIHNVFSLAELLTHTTFHLASSTIRFSLNAAEECVQVLDGLFGETETSKALAAFICLVKKELSGHEDDLALSDKVGRISALGQVTKALTVISRSNREMTQSRQHNRSSFSGRYKELPALPRLEPAKPPRQQLFEKISRYVRFASGAYGTNFLKILGIGKAREFLIEHSAEHDHNHQSFAFHTDVPVEHILTSSFRNPNALHPPSLIAPVHYLVVDAKTEAVVVSLRGTLGLSDLITDLTSSYSSFTTSDGHVGKVHAGMLESAEKVARGPVRDAVMEALKKHPTFSLVLTGHSLGGGVAALLALIWSRKTVDENGDTAFHTCPNNGFPIRPVQCFIYGPPAVMSLDLSHHYKSLITTVVYRHDIVPCLSLGLIRDFRNVAVNICNEQGMAERVIGKVLGVFKSYPTGSSVPSDDPSSTSPQSIEDDLWYWALLKTLRADMRAEKLYPPGSVYWIDATTPAIVASTPTAASTSNSDSGSNSTPPPTTPTSDSAKPSRIATALTVHHVDDVEKAFSEFTFSRTMFLDQYVYIYRFLTIQNHRSHF